MEVAPGAVPQDARDRRRRPGGQFCAEWERNGWPAVQGLLQVEMAAEPLNVLFDPEHLRRVLVNLLDNARRHCSGNAGALLLMPARPRRQRGAAGLVQRWRADPADVERHLFEPFSRRAAAARAWACIFAARRASVTARASTTACDPPVSAAATSFGRDAPPGRGCRRPHCLLHDDPPPFRTSACWWSTTSRDLRTLYELTLLREGYDIDTAGSVEDAIAQLDSRVYSPLITDMRSPDGTGLDLLRRPRGVGL